MSRPTPDLLVLGDLNADVVLAGGDVQPRFGEAEQIVDRGALTLGASGAILACGARLGLRVSYVGRVGDDPAGRMVLDMLSARGVDVDACLIDGDRPTGITVVLRRPEDRAMLTALGTVPTLRGADVPPGLLGAARHVHVAAFYLQHALRPDVPALFAHARAAGATASLDTNWDPSGRWAGGLDAALAETDGFMPNAAEASAISGRADPVDTTGAGDSFGAGLLFGLLAGRPLSSALALAVACETASTRALGGIDGQATREEVL